MALDFPTAQMELTHLLVVGDLEQARTVYRDVLAAEVYREDGGTSVVLRFLGAWLLLVTGGGPTPDKPDVVFVPPADPSKVSHAMTIHVLDCQAAYVALRCRVPDSTRRVSMGSALLLPRSGWPSAGVEPGEDLTRS